MPSTEFVSRERQFWNLKVFPRNSMPFIPLPSSFGRLDWPLQIEGAGFSTAFTGLLEFRPCHLSASASARSFPSTRLCPGTHLSLSIFVLVKLQDQSWVLISYFQLFDLFPCCVNNICTLSEDFTLCPLILTQDFNFE